MPRDQSAGPPGRRWPAWPALLGSLLLACALAAGLQQLGRERLQQALQRDAAQLADQVHALTSESRAMGGVTLLGLVEPRLHELLQGRLAPQAPALQQLLRTVIDEYDADNMFVLDRTGRTVAYLTNDGSTAGLGRDLSARPYFRRAVGGHANLYPAIGRNTGERGLYLAAPVRSQGAVLGAVVVKIGVDQLDLLLGRYPHAALLVSPDGLVFGGNRRQWQLQLLAPLSEPALAALRSEQQFGDLFAQQAPPVLPLRLDAGQARLNGIRHEAGEAALGWSTTGPGWRLLLLQEQSLAQAWAWPLAGGAAALVLTLGLWLALQRRHRRRDQRARERQAAQAAVARELVFQQRLIDVLPNPVFVKDAQGRFTTLNRAFEEAYQVRREDMVGRTVLDVTVLDEASRADAHAYDMDIVARGILAHRAFDSHWSDGCLHHTLFWGQGLRDEQGAPAGMVGVVLDVSEQARAREALRERELQLRELLESTPGAVIVTNDEGRVLFHNQHALAMYRIDAAQLAREGMRVRYARPAQRAELFERLRRDGRVRAAEVEMLRGDGTRLWAEVSFSRGSFGDDPGAVFGWSVDVTQQRETALAMRAAKDAAEAAAAAKSDFLSNMSHEIRTPLNSIVGLSYLALQAETAAPQRALLQQMQGAARTLLGIVGDVLDFSSLDAGSIALADDDFDLDALVDRLAGQARERLGGQRLELLFDIGDAVPRRLLGDGARLAQVLDKLLDNAIKFTAQGEVVLTCRHREEAGDRVVLEIGLRDTGIGMTAAQREQAFVPFSQADGSATRRFGGTGLGLPICRRLVEAAGGRIAFDSTPGQGTQLRLDWPCRVQPAAPPPAPLPAGLRARPARVLDGHAGAATLLVGLLQRLGVAAEPQGQEPAAVAPQALLFIDAQLAGPPLHERVQSCKAGQGGVQVVLLAAAGDTAPQRAAALAGADAVLAKPVVEAALRRLLPGLEQIRPVPADAAAAPAWTDAQATAALARACAMLQDMDAQAMQELELLEPWLRHQLAPAELRQLWHGLRRYDLDEALALLRAAPGLARWHAAAGMAAP